MYKKIYLKIYFKNYLLFIAFGFLIVLAVYMISSSLLRNSLDNIKGNFADSYFKIISYSLKNSIDESKQNILTIKNEKEFKNYINKESDKEKLERIFYDYVSSKNEILQLRFIDINGNEKIRIQKYDEDLKAEIIPIDKLQNRKDVDYFKKSMELKEDQFFISNFSLNKEYGKIQIPIQPTIRVATCVYDKDGIKKGILILNINMNRFLKIFKNFENFDSYLVDKEGNYLLHPDLSKQWSENLKSNFKLKDNFDDMILVKILTHNIYKHDFIYSYSLENVINNNQGLRIIYIPHSKYITNILKESNIQLLKFIIPLTLILGYISALYSTRMRKELILALAKNKRNIKIIDKFVPISITNDKGIILEANQAFAKLTGYTSEELIGQSHSKLKSGNLNEELYKDLWKTLKENKIWTGELENIKKNGQTYWIDMYIEPRFNEETKQTEFVSISHNITDKKLTENLAQTDHLTNLYNRQKLDKELKKALYSVNRYNSQTSIMMLDIDYFKLVNDRYGHNVGDTLLVEFSNIIKECIRESDILGRWGGEEFLIITPNTSKDEIKVLANKIKDYIDKYNFKVVGHKTVSIGYTQIQRADSNIIDLIQRADDALYRAKEYGRNRVEGDEVIVDTSNSSYSI